MKKNLWTKNFTCVTIATILTAIGGEAMNLPISLLVFDETKSTFLSALVMVCGVLPDVIFPVFVAPLIDKGRKKRWIIGMDFLMMILFIVMGILVGKKGFRYGLYLVFILIIGTISVFYRLAYGAWYPDLIPNGLEQKGFSVSSTIYPVVIIVMSPVAAILYEKMSMQHLFWMVAGITLVSIGIESCITETWKKTEESYSAETYFEDIKEGFHYLKKEKGIRNIYTYMSVASGTGMGMNVLTQAFYQTQPWLNVTMLGMLKASEMLGRTLSGIFQYLKEIPVNKRYIFTKFVYTFYSTMDMLLLFMPFPAMLVNRFACGALGTCGGTVRETAVQSYLPPNIRARVNAVFGVLFAVGEVMFQLLAGVLGQIMSYRTACVIFGIVDLACIFFLIVLPKNVNRPIYEAVRMEE